MKSTQRRYPQKKSDLIKGIGNILYHGNILPRVIANVKGYFISK